MDSSQTSAKNLESKDADESAKNLESKDADESSKNLKSKDTQKEFKQIFETDDVLVIVNAVLQMAGYGLPLASNIPILRKVLRNNPGLGTKLKNVTYTGLDLAKNLPSASLEGLRGFFPKKPEVFDKEVQVNMDMDEEIVKEGDGDIPEDKCEESGSPPIKTPVLITSKL